MAQRNSSLLDLIFKKLTAPNPEIATTLDRWENDPLLIPLMRPNQDKEELERQTAVTVDSLTKRLEHQSIYLIYADGQLVGEMNFQIDPGHLYKKEAGTAWIGIGIGEPTARGKGVGARAMQYLEKQIQVQGLARIELGVFEFNDKAIKLYKIRAIRRSLTLIISLTGKAECGKIYAWKNT